MTRGAKMLLMAREGGDNRRTEREGYNYPRNEYGGTRMNYGYPDMNYPRMDYTPYSEHPEREWEYTSNGDTEARFRDRRGREHYDNGRYAPKGAMEPEDYPESRRYRRDDAGRSEYPLVPPVYRGDVMNRIGFAAEPDMEIKRDYRTDIAYPHMDEMGHRTSTTTMGHAKGSEMTLTDEMADEWMHGLHNEDGTKGAHWTKDQVKQVMNQKGIKADPTEVYAVMNALYADYCSVFKKHGVNTIDFYVDMTSAWLNDKDAKEGKTARYFQYITK